MVLHEETRHNVIMNITKIMINNKKTIRQRYELFRQRIEVATLDRIHEDHHAVYAHQGDADVFAKVWLTHPSVGEANSTHSYRDNVQEMVDEKLRSYRF